MKQQKVLVTGAAGQLGSDIMTHLNAANIDCLGVDRVDYDLTNRDLVFKNIKEYMPTLIIHCAAYVAVDKAEEDRDLCYKINVDATKNIVDVANEINSDVMYFSTDYIFNSQNNEPLEIDQPKEPINHYGDTKNIGEEYVINNVKNYYIARISWVFGKNGVNFIKTMLKLAETRDKLTVVNDQVGSPTYTEDVAAWVVSVIEMQKYGIYHVTNEGFCSWYEFALKIFDLANVKIDVEPVSSDNFKTAAKRPANSKMSKKSSIENGVPLLPTWEDALGRYLKEIL